ncbi:MAG: cysteine desulfurase-like protein [Vulcanimicrobiaceae bacterium]
MSDFPIAAVRGAFPSLTLTDNGRPRIYLDNPAGTQVPRSVADAASRCLLQTNANLGGYFPTSVAAGQIVEEAHQAMAHFLGAASEREIVIGPSMTSLTFAISRSLGRSLGPGDEIVVTKMDHDGNVSPWLAMAQERGVTVRWLPFDQDTWVIEPEALDRVLSAKTRIVALNYASNLTGSINDIAALAAKARRAGALVYVDAVQFAPHGFIDVQALGCDFLACSSYKFLGPHLGILWGREALLQDLYAYKVRPATDELPWKFETGTPQIELQAALTATVEYFARLGSLVGSQGDTRQRIRAAFKAAIAWESSLAQRLIDGLGQFTGVTIHGVTDRARIASRVPTISFTHATRRSSEIAEALAHENIFIWSGHNYALEIVRSLGIDEDDGVVRIGLAQYNTAGEVDATLAALERILTVQRVQS